MRSRETRSDGIFLLLGVRREFLSLAPTRAVLRLRPGPLLVAQHAQRLAVIDRALPAAVVHGPHVIALPSVSGSRLLHQRVEPRTVTVVTHRRPRGEYSGAPCVLAPHHLDPADQIVTVQPTLGAHAAVPFVTRLAQRPGASALSVLHRALFAAKQIRHRVDELGTLRDRLGERADVTFDDVQVQVRRVLSERVREIPRSHALQAQQRPRGD